jgi:preprotein translocase subunit SecG
MDFVRGLLLVVEALCAVLLIVLILLQKSKSEGLGMAFGGGAGEALFGARAGNVLTKITVWLSGIFLATTLLIAVSYAGKQERSIVESTISDVPAATAQMNQSVDVVPPADVNVPSVPPAE